MNLTWTVLLLFGCVLVTTVAVADTHGVDSVIDGDAFVLDSGE